VKGIVFTELLEMAEEAVGEEMVDEVLDALDLESGGAYSAVGNYPCSELVAIVSELSARTGIAGDDLQRQFGNWMHRRFTELYPQFFADKDNALKMLDAIESEVHVEVRKLYPDAELPRFETRWEGDDRLQMTYRSERPLVPFCHGLVQSCVDHFGETASINVAEATAHKAVFDVRLEK